MTLKFNKDQVRVKRNPLRQSKCKRYDNINHEMIFITALIINFEMTHKKNKVKMPDEKRKSNNNNNDV